MNNQIYIFKVRKARSKAISLAILEVLYYFEDLSVENMISRPMSEEKNTFAIEIPERYTTIAENRFENLGYVEMVYKLNFDISSNNKYRKYKKWKGKVFEAELVYKENKTEIRNNAPDRREFILQDKDGNLKKVKGYRGDGGDLSRRALPVCDSRLLVNLVNCNWKNGTNFLDPFAGAGGIIIEAVKRFDNVFSNDIDPVLEYGLKAFGANHTILDVNDLSYDEYFFDAIATEIPFDENVTDTVANSISILRKILKFNAKISIMTAENQADKIRESLKINDLKILFDESLNRKGTNCHIFLSEKIKSQSKQK